MYEMSCQSRFDARYWMLGAGALGRPRGLVWGGRREEGSGRGTHVYLWWIHFDILLSLFSTSPKHTLLAIAPSVFSLLSFLSLAHS